MLAPSAPRPDRSTSSYEPASTPASASCADDIAGIAVNVGARIGALAGASEVPVSSTVRELVLGSGLDFVQRGSHVLKGVAGEWRLFAVVDDARADARPVHEVDAETAARTPGPRETMRVRDRALLATAERAPRVAHALGNASWARLRPRRHGGAD